jgi:hypothetical protein
LDEVLSALERTTDEDVDRLIAGLRHLAALVPPDAHPTVLSVLSKALVDPRQPVQRAAVLIALYWERPECLPALQPLTGRRDAIGSLARSARAVIVAVEKVR